ncbi:MAG: integrin alpha [Isosphaeraceae bacterium]
MASPPSPQAALNSAYFDGNVTGNLLGYALTPTGDINGDGLNEIAIGAPGTSSNSGAVFLVPGNPTLPSGAYTLNAAVNPVAPVFALPIITTQGSSNPLFLGGSLGARVWPVSAPPNFVDGDTLGDFLIGAPGFSTSSTTTPRQLAGTAFLLEGAFLSSRLPVPPNLTIPVQIGVGSPTAPFSINASTPDDLQIWVSSNSTVSPAFRPTTMLSNPTTVTVNGVTFSATVTPDGDFNNDGITDVILTISPRSNLNLTPGSTVTFTIRGQTNEASPRNWSGSASVEIARNTPVVPVLPGPGVSAFAASFNIPPNGEVLVPTVQSLSKLMYMPIPASIATQQYRSATGFSQRLARFYGLVKTSKQNGTRFYNRPSRGNTLGYGVFARGKFPVGQVRFKPVKTGVYAVPANLNSLNG